MEQTICVTGEGRLSLPPDTICLHLEQNDSDSDYSRAVALSAEHTALLRECFTALGFDKSDLKTVSYRVESEYESVQDEKGIWRQRFTGYRAVHSLLLRFPADNERLGQVLSALAPLPARPEFHLEYTVADPEAARDRLLELAVEDAKQQAGVLAAAAHVTLGPILRIDHSRKDMDFVARPVGRVMEAAAMAKGANIALDIQPEDIKSSDSVSVVWAISQA